MMTLGQKIREVRKQNNMSQDTLAEKLFVSRQAVSKWENDSSQPTTDNLIALSKLFGMSVDYFLNTDETTPSNRDKKEDDYKTEKRITALESDINKLTDTNKKLSFAVCALVVMCLFMLLGRMRDGNKIDNLEWEVSNLRQTVTSNYYSLSEMIMSGKNDYEYNNIQIIPYDIDAENGKITNKIVYSPNSYDTNSTVKILFDNGIKEFSGDAVLEGNNYIAYIDFDFDDYGFYEIYILKTTGTETIKTKANYETNPCQYIVPQINNCNIEIGFGEGNPDEISVTGTLTIDYLPENPPASVSFVISDNNIEKVYCFGELSLEFTNDESSAAFSDGTELILKECIAAFTDDASFKREKGMDYSVLVTVHDSFGRGTGQSIAVGGIS